MLRRDPRTKLPETISTTIHRDDDIVRRHDAHAKAVMKHNADKTKHGRKTSINVGDIVLVRQTRVDKLSTPFTPTPLTVTDRRGSMITASRPECSTITGNQSKLHQLPKTDDTQRRMVTRYTCLRTYTTR